MTNSDYWLMLFLLFSMNPDPDGLKKSYRKRSRKSETKGRITAELSKY